MPNAFTVSIWGDEGFSAILSMKSLSEIIKIVAQDTSPPLWNISEWIFFNLFGTDEVVIRSLSLLYFLIAVFFTYKIAEHFWNKKTATLAAILTFLNPFFFIYAFEGRMYSILAAGVAASMYFFIKRKWAGYVIATLWAMYSHHFAIFALFTQGLWFLYEFIWGKKKEAKGMFLSFIAVGIGYIPWLYPLYMQTKRVESGFWLGTPGVKEFFGVLGEYLGAGIRTTPYEFFGVKIHVITLTFVLAALLVRNWRKKIKENVFLVSWFLMPIALTWLVSQVFQSIFFNRYLLYTIPGAMLILASQKRKKLSSVLIGVVIILFSLIDFHYFTNPTKPPFRELADFAKNSRNDGDVIINWYSNGTHHIWETKYYEIGGPIYVPSEGELPFFVGTALLGEGDVIRTLPDTNKIGVVTSGPIEEVVLPSYTEIGYQTFDNLKFIWYLKEK